LAAGSSRSSAPKSLCTALIAPLPEAEGGDHQRLGGRASKKESARVAAGANTLFPDQFIGGGSLHSWLTIHRETIPHGSQTRGWRILGWVKHATPKALGVIPKDDSRSGSGFAGWRGWVHSLARETQKIGWPSDPDSDGWHGWAHSPVRGKLIVPGPLPGSAG
jgi:hypothetical protein